MRDAFGGTFMLKLIVVFVVFYVSFATIAVNYAKIFRLKNRVIDIIEQYQLDLSNEKSWDTEIVDDFLSENVYNVGNNQGVQDDCKGRNGRLTRNGVCVSQGDINLGNYYDITLYMVVQLPILDVNFAIPIGGHTKDFGNYTKLKRG